MSLLSNSAVTSVKWPCPGGGASIQSRILSNGEVLSRRELSDEVIAGLGLTDTELAETLAGGGNRAASRSMGVRAFIQSWSDKQTRKRICSDHADSGRDLLREYPNGVEIQRLQ